jgi:hypothetical protein
LNARFPLVLLLNPRFALLNPRFPPLLLKDRFDPPLGVNPRDALPRPEAGGVNVRQPGREEVIAPRPPAFARPLNPDDGRLNEPAPRLPLTADGRLIDPAPRLALNPLAARDVLIGRFELNPPRAATELPPKLLRDDAVKNRCVFDGACRYEPGFAARLTGL